MAEIDQDRGANDSPRSGVARQVAPLVWCVIVVTTTAIATWFVMKP